MEVAIEQGDENIVKIVKQKIGIQMAGKGIRMGY